MSARGTMSAQIAPTKDPIAFVDHGPSGVFRLGANPQVRRRRDLLDGRRGVAGLSLGRRDLLWPDAAVHRQLVLSN